MKIPYNLRQNSIHIIVEEMKTELLILGKKIEAGEYNDFANIIQKLANYSENTANSALENYAFEFAEMIENANAQRRSSLLAMRSKIHSLNQFIEKNFG